MGELLLELDTRDIIEHNSPVNIKIINNTNDNLRYKRIWKRRWIYMDS